MHAPDPSAPDARGRGFFVTGTDTDVGKTFFTTALLQALRARGLDAGAFKPVQTGCTLAADGTLRAPDVEVYRSVQADAPPPALALVMPASPHLAAAREHAPLALATLIDASRSALDRHALTLVEGAGGVRVPLDGRHTTLDLMRALDLPVILVAHNRLGMLNHTLLSLDAVRDAGLTLAALVINTPDLDTRTGDAATIAADNIAWLRAHVGNTHPVIELGPHATPAAAAATLAPQVDALLVHTAPGPARAAAKADAALDAAHIWHPYTSALNPLPTYAIERSDGNYLYHDGRPLLDGMASWWCAIHGYNVPQLAAAARAQIGRMPHVMFGGIRHAPAVDLTRRLLPLLPAGLEHVFYCDSGSVSVEVAIKMALQYQHSRGRPQRRSVLTPRGGYHGDTFGAMSVCDPDTGMHHLFRHMLSQQIFIERPQAPWGAPFDEATLEPLRAAFARHHTELAAVILEPVVQGAGGMWFYHPRYLQALRALCDEHEVLLICDEIATGFGRTGTLFAVEHAGITPDILCLGKALTGGFMSLAATVATRAVAHGISQDGGVFMHGPTFMANPLACRVAEASVALLLDSPWQARVRAIEQGLRAGLAPCAEHADVADVRTLGAIGVVEMRAPVNVARLQAFFVAQGVWIRPFARNLYVMPPYTLDADEIARLCTAIRLAIQQGMHA